MDISKNNEKNNPMYFVNPIIKNKNKETSTYEEGCLSVPDIRAEVKRPESITLEYQDLKQDLHQENFSGIVSRVIQHEIDHLSGKFFVDYLSPSKRILIHKRLLEISKNGRPSTGIIL